jgi:demethylspheroidene O-methyltransferase
VFDLMAGFVHTQVLLSCVRLRIFEHLQRGPKTLAELATLCEQPEAGLQRLIQSAITLRVLEKRSGLRYGLGALGKPIASHPGIAAMIEHNQLLYQDMADPVAMLQNDWHGSMAAYWPYADAQVAQASQREGQAQQLAARYSELMAASQGFVIQELLAAYPFEEHQCVLDVGGGKGRWISELAHAYPDLSLMLFDLPGVANVANAFLQQQGVAQRVSLKAGDFTQNDLPLGADLVTLVRVAHDHPDEVVLALLKNIHRALPPGGTLLIAEPMAQDAGEASVSDAYFHFYLLAMGSGRLRTPTELFALMRQAGFGHLEIAPSPMPLHAKVLVGRKLEVYPG